MDVPGTIRHLGGWATWSQLRSAHPRRAIERARDDGHILRLARGRYTLATTDEARTEASRVGGVASHLSAALLHGWPVKTVPDQFWITLPANRGSLRTPVAAHIHRADLSVDERRTRVTEPVRTVLDCARMLPFDEALVVADSALRSRDVQRAELVESAKAARGPGSRAARRVAEHAHPGAANPLESVLRAISIEAGLVLTPQLEISTPGFYARADLGDLTVGLILEAEGYETHGTREGLRRDCRRHTEFAVCGLTSMRFAYEHVMFEQAWVRESLTTWLSRHRPHAA